MKQRENTLTVGDVVAGWKIEGFGRAGGPGFERAWKTPLEDWPEGTELVLVRRNNSHGGTSIAFKSFPQMNELVNKDRRERGDVES